MEHFYAGIGTADHPGGRVGLSKERYGPSTRRKKNHSLGIVGLSTLSGRVMKTWR